MRFLTPLFALAWLFVWQATHAQTTADKTYALRNGRWFDGKTFKAKTFGNYILYKPSHFR